MSVSVPLRQPGPGPGTISAQRSARRKLKRHGHCEHSELSGVIDILARVSLLLALLWLGIAGASAQELPDGPVLAAADLREGTSLEGMWTYSIDPYRDGVAGFHG